LAARVPNFFLPTILLAASAAYYVLSVLWLRRGRGLASFDTYTYFYPNIVHALHSLGDGGGLLWNRYQDCGQPFFAISQTGLLYPVNLLFALLERDPALAAVAFVNLCIGGIGAYLLCNELRLGVLPALSGALLFQLGATSSMLAAWSPMHIAPFVWMPLALWRVERLLRDPSAANVIWLGVVLTLQLLPGFPQTSFFTYQVIALRAVWALVGRTLTRPRSALIGLALAGVLPLCLAAVQILPSLAVVRESLRDLPLTQREIGFSYTWQSLRGALTGADYLLPTTVMLLVMAVLSVAALVLPHAAGTLVVFYALVVVLYALLSLGDAGWLFPLYARLPGGSTFRMPQRLIWVAGFALAVLGAYGVDALMRQAARPRVRARAVAAAAVLAAMLAFFLVGGRWPTTAEWVVAGLLLGAAAAVWRGQRVAVGVVLVLAIAVNLGAAMQRIAHTLRGGEPYAGNAAAFDLLQRRQTAQDRVMLLGGHGDLALLPKSASLFRLPSIYDYEPQVSRTYADYVTWMRTGSRMQSILAWYYPIDGPLPKGFRRRLFDLTAARYVLVGRAAEPRTAAPREWKILARNARWTMYENPAALDRARFVPQLAVVAENEVLARLDNGSNDARTEVLVSAAPASGFTGLAAPASGSVSFALDDAEHVVLDVDASAAGFLFLADQYADGWYARVNGAPQEILRANHTFRAVEVPAGRSRVEFRYRPWSLYVGAAVSSLTALALVAFAVRRRRRVADPIPAVVAEAPVSSQPAVSQC
jgi:hypothetical protein